MNNEIREDASLRRQVEGKKREPRMNDVIPPSSHASEFTSFVPSAGQNFVVALSYVRPHFGQMCLLECSGGRLPAFNSFAVSRIAKPDARQKRTNSASQSLFTAACCWECDGPLLGRGSSCESMPFLNSFTLCLQIQRNKMKQIIKATIPSALRKDTADERKSGKYWR
jgi:hypothetical protein